MSLTFKRLRRELPMVLVATGASFLVNFGSNVSVNGWDMWLLALKAATAYAIVQTGARILTLIDH